MFPYTAAGKPGLYCRRKTRLIQPPENPAYTVAGKPGLHRRRKTRLTPSPENPAYTAAGNGGIFGLAIGMNSVLGVGYTTRLTMFSSYFPDSTALCV